MMDPHTGMWHNKAVHWWCFASCWPFLTACDHPKDDHIKVTDDAAAGGTVNGANRLDTGNFDEPLGKGVKSSEEATMSIAYGDPALVFDDSHQSAELEMLRSQFLDSLHLAKESQDRFYERMFSKANFRAFHSGLSHAMEEARERQAVSPGVEGLVSFMTGAGLLVVVSCVRSSGTFHISIEQQLRPTTHATCSLFGHFALTMFGENDVQMDVPPYYTDSGVHHLVIRFRPEVELKIRDYETTLEMHEANYEPIHFEYAPELSLPGGRKTHAKRN